MNTFHAKTRITPTAHTPQVAVVMRTKNRLLLLHRALASVLFQTLPTWHLYLVNDGGDQAALETMLAPYRPLLGNKITVVHHATSQGMEAASNAALALISEDFFVIHDDDDSWHPDFLKHSVAFLTKPQNARFLAVTTGTIVVNEEIQNDLVTEHSRVEWGANRATIDFTKILHSNLFPPISLLMRSSLLQSVGQYNAALPVLGDWDYNLRIMTQGDIAFLKNNLAFYHCRVPGAPSAYSNTITTQLDQHQLYNTLLRNQWLRDSLQQSPHLIGLMQGLVFASSHTPPGGTPATHHLHHIEGLLHQINHRLEIVELTALWVNKLLRPVHKMWHVALPARRVVARLRGRV